MRPGPQRRAPTAAERRAAEVNARRGERPPPDEGAERARIEARTFERWIDEGASESPTDLPTARRSGAGTPGGARPASQLGPSGLRAEAVGAAARAQRRPSTSTARSPDVSPGDAAAIRRAASDGRRAAVLVERLAQAQQALDRERFADARRLAAPLARELPDVAAVHELLGVIAYRTGRWKQAVAELEAGQSLRANVELLPVLADSYRALRRWSDVERIWTDVREVSPAPAVLAEARIVAAGALADRGDLAGALRTMDRARTVPARVRDHHLRQWYVLGDLHDRAGDPIEAGRWFQLVARHDDEFVDVTQRLRALGR